MSASVVRPIQLVHAKQHGNPDGSRRVTATLMAQDQGDYPESCGLATEADLRAAGFARLPSPDDPAAVEFFAERLRRGDFASHGHTRELPNYRMAAASFLAALRDWPPKEAVP